MEHRQPAHRPLQCCALLFPHLRPFSHFRSSELIFSDFDEQYVNSVALNAIGWRYYLVFLCLLFVWGYLIWYFMVETKGLTLEEMDILFKGKDSAVAQVDARLEAQMGADGVDIAQKVHMGDDKESI
jgi:fatty acid desaturase